MTDDGWERDAAHDVRKWTVIPALPGTRAFMFDGTPEGAEIPVHAWLVEIDILDGRGNELSFELDLSMVRGKPMVIDACEELTVLGHGDLGLKFVELLEPGWPGPTDEGLKSNAYMLGKARSTSVRGDLENEG